MWLLHRLHMVDCAVAGTSSSVPQLKHVTRRTSREGGAAAVGGATGAWRKSSSRKYWRHFLQTVE